MARITVHIRLLYCMYLFIYIYQMQQVYKELYSKWRFTAINSHGTFMGKPASSSGVGGFESVREDYRPSNVYLEINSLFK